MFFRSLTFRLIVALAIVLGLVQVTLALLFSSALDTTLRERFTGSLKRRIDDVSEAYELVQAERPEEDAASVWQAALVPFQDSGLLLTVRLPDGRFVSSLGLQGRSLPVIQGPVQRLEPGEVQRFPQDAFQAVRLDLANGGTVIGAGPLETLEDSLTQTRVMIWSLGGFGVLATLIVGGWITYRGLSPLLAVTARLRLASASRAESELPLPPNDDELRELVEAYNRMVTRLTHQFSEQRQFMGRVAHELKTPLAVLSGRLQTNADGFQDQALRDSLMTELRRLLRLVNGFLILSRSEQQISLANARTVSLEETVVKVIARCAALAREGGHRVVPSFGDDTREPLVRGDADLLFSMLENLVRNAIRHSPEGESISVSLEIQGNRVILRVVDRGPGIEESLQRKIFSPFYQGDVRARAGEGGLGLPIVRSVADLHGGHVQVDSHPGSGSTFIVTLPLAE